jgi:hypothetical protein
MNDITVTVTIDGNDYTATLEDGQVTLTENGKWAGKGRWDEPNARIEDCAADLGEDVYDALDAALDAAIRAAV